ncbi:MAG: MerR family transcriptional regulator [Dehalococcoidia bacterium]
MAQQIRGKTYYRTSEACRLAGISKATFFRWIKEGTLDDTSRKDRNGWRLFTQGDVNKMKAEATRTNGK